MSSLNSKTHIVIRDIVKVSVFGQFTCNEELAQCFFLFCFLFCCTSCSCLSEKYFLKVWNLPKRCKNDFIAKCFIYCYFALCLLLATTMYACIRFLLRCSYICIFYYFLLNIYFPYLHIPNKLFNQLIYMFYMHTEKPGYSYFCVHDTSSLPQLLITASFNARALVIFIVYPNGCNL